MRVELHLDSGCTDPHATVYTPRLSPCIQAAIELLEQEYGEDIFTAQREDKIFVVEPNSIEIIRTEGKELVLYDKLKTRYLISKPLYQVQEQLGKSFVRISKSAIVNFRSISHVSASFNGTMELVMKNGVEEVITRSFRKQFKERLGV